MRFVLGNFDDVHLNGFGVLIREMVSPLLCIVGYRRPAWASFAAHVPNPWLTSCTCAQIHEEGHNDLMLSENQILNVLARFVQSFARKAGFDTNELTIEIHQLVSWFTKWRRRDWRRHIQFLNWTLRPNYYRQFSVACFEEKIHFKCFMTAFSRLLRHPWFFTLTWQYELRHFLLFFSKSFRPTAARAYPP